MAFGSTSTWLHIYKYVTDGQWIICTHPPGPLLRSNIRLLVILYTVHVVLPSHLPGLFVYIVVILQHGTASSIGYYQKKQKTNLKNPTTSSKQGCRYWDVFISHSL
jgi:hypothetical protein